MKKITYFFIVIIILVLGAVGSILLKNTDDTEDIKGLYDDFAICLKDKGAVFYGAFWCGHCNNTKEMFGSSVKFLPYVECSTDNGKGQVQICTDKKIEGYPTWEFSDNSRELGEVSLEKLSEKTGCILPLS